MSKHTLNGTRKKALRVSGFRSRMSTAAGRRLITRRRRKGRKSLAISKMVNK